MFDLSALCQLSDIKSRSISPENYTGAPGKGGMCPPEQGIASHASKDLGIGWKVNPCVRIDPKSTFEIADIDGPGMIRHIWLTPRGAGGTRSCASTGTARRIRPLNVRWGISSAWDGTNIPRSIPWLSA